MLNQAPPPLVAIIPGHWEFLLILVVVLVLFAPRLPSAMRSLGAGIVELKKGIRSPSQDSSPDEGGQQNDVERPPN